MTDSFSTLEAEFRFEPEPIKGSRFLACLAPALDEAQASEFRDRIREEFPHATHTCWAWRLGVDGEQTRSHDDGEPSGSAGRPILAQLEGHAVTQICACVTRWFGGTKLGVGGLVRAYGGAVGMALDRAPIVVREVETELELHFPYECTSAVQAALHTRTCQTLESDYGVEVRLRIRVPRRVAAELALELTERTAGRVRCEATKRVHFARMTPPPNDSAATTAALEKRIATCEAIARQLEESPAERRALTERVVEQAHGILDGLEQRPVWTTEPGARDELLSLGIPEEPAALELVLDLFEREIDGPGLQPASGGHLGYIPGGGVFPGALGDFLAAVTNRYSGVRYAGPGAVHVENLLLRWLRDELGMPQSAHGTLTSGGSIATLIAFVAARDARRIRAANLARSVVYTTAQAHHCVAKALAIAGLAETIQRPIALDERFRMRADELSAAVRADRAAGLNPFLVVATAGTTDTGALDPLDEVASIAEREDLWFHVDGAYGGAFALVPELRSRLAGIERADSLVIDPHKGLFLPYGSGAVLVRDPAHLATSHGFRGAYLQDATDLAEEPSPADLSPELTRHFRGMRMWLPLVLHGAERFRQALLEKHLLAGYFHERALELGFETGPRPELSVALFRWVPPDGSDPDAFNRALLQQVLDDGRVFLSSTTLDGRFWLRVAVLAFRTHKDRVDHLLGVLARAVAS